MFTIKFVPKKNQVFSIGRTINWAKCSECTMRDKGNPCGYMSCKNYAREMVAKRYTVKEFWTEWKEQNPDLAPKLFVNKQLTGEGQGDYATDFINDFADACLRFPKGMYWRVSRSIMSNQPRAFVLCRMSRSRFERSYGDFIDLSEVRLYDHARLDKKCAPYCYQFCTDTAEKKAEVFTNKFNELRDLWEADYAAKHEESVGD